VTQPATAELDTPVGPLALVLDVDTGTVLASGFGPLDALTGRVRTGPQSGPQSGPLPAAPDAVVAPVAAAVERYFAGDLHALDAVPVDQPGTAFQQGVWAALRSVPPGGPVSYAQLAVLAGYPGSARAVGQVCSRNLAAPFVPCHRVVPAGGGVGGYAYGAGVKTRLLAHERGAPVGA
jgi:methylated-DNA-[protein]-cysteine S-methyltransferase